MKKRKFLRDAAFYSGSLFFARLLVSIRGILIPKFLGPTQYGVYNGLLIIPEYLLRVHLGTLDALMREIPFCYARQDYEKARLIRNTVFFQYLFTTSISILLILIGAIIFRSHLSPTVFYALIFICLWVFFFIIRDIF